MMNRRIAASLARVEQSGLSPLDGIEYRMGDYARGQPCPIRGDWPR